MKSTLLVSIIAVSLLAVLAVAQPPHPRYTVTDLGTLGGPGTNSAATDMNNAGWVAGSSNLVADGPQHAFVWFGGGPLTDLGTLGGKACPACNSGGGGPNASGEAIMSSETSVHDPLNEDFCRYGTNRQCLAAVWKNGALKALPTLLGDNRGNAQAFGINNPGQVVGFSENNTPDSTCLTPNQKRRFDAVIWEPNGEIRKLSHLPGDDVGFAFGINDNGQVVGGSGLCSKTIIPPPPSGWPHAVLWEKDGSATELKLGGEFNLASSINNRGDVTGTTQLSEDGNVQSFLCTKNGTGIYDCTTKFSFKDDFVTIAPCCRTVNDRRQVVGFSCGPSGCRAFLWQDNTLMDLNDLIPADSGWYLQFAQSINAAGQIVGFGSIKGEVHAFLATPIHGEAGH